MKLPFTPLFAWRPAWAAALLLALPLAGRAQTTFGVGPRLGLNLSTAQLKGMYRPDVQYHLGSAVGLVAEVGFGHFAVQPAVLYSQRGFRTRRRASFSDPTDPALGTASVEEQERFKLNYLEMPLNFVYRQRADGNGFQLLAGPYVSVGFNGKYRNVNTQTTTFNGQTETERNEVRIPVVFDSDNTGFDSMNYHLRSFDIGLNAGLGYRKGPLLAQAGYSLGFANSYPNAAGADEEVSIKNRAFQLSLTYLFGLGK